MDRRVFLQWLGLGWLVSTLPGCLTQLQASQASAGGARGTSALIPRATPGQPSVFLPVGSVGQLEQTGFLLNQNSPVGSVLVVQNSAHQLKAVNPTCPHRGCQVRWQAGQEEFFCPCHDARFGPEGSVLAGPTRSNLETYATRVENGTVLVSRNNMTDRGQGDEAQSQTAPSDSRRRDHDQHHGYDDDHDGNHDHDDQGNHDHDDDD